MKLSKQLKEWRGVGRSGRGKFNQAEAAARLGVPVRTYTNWEQGHRTPKGIALQTVLERIK